MTDAMKPARKRKPRGQKWPQEFGQADKWKLCSNGRLARRGACTMKRSRRTHSAAFKAKVALVAVKGDQMLAPLSQRFDVHPQQITQRKAQLLEKATQVFASAGERRGAEGPSLKDLQAKIGQLALENDFLSVALGRIDEASAKR